jgi:alanyl-tRNA synthetase
MTADFNGELTADELERIEEMANEVVVSRKNIRAYYPDREALLALEYRSKLDFYENVRIVEIEDTDKCACCAPHVENTGEVGIIKILDAIRYKGGMRLTMVAGFDALSDYRARLSEIKHISMVISAKQSEVADGVDRLVEDMGKMRGKLSCLKREMMQKKLEEMDETDGSIILFEEFDDMLALRNLANEAVKKSGKVFAVFSKSEEGYKYIIASNTLDLKALSGEINSAIDGRGGGSKQMIQGSCTADEETIKSYFSSETYN